MLSTTLGSLDELVWDWLAGCCGDWMNETELHACAHVLWENQKHNGSFSQFLAPELQKALEFPERSICYANEVTHGEPLASFRMGLVTRKNNHLSRGWDFQPTEGEGVGDRIQSCSQVNRSCLFSENSRLLRLRVTSWGENTSTCWEGDVLTPYGEGRGHGSSALPPRSCPVCLFIWLLLSHILYNKTVIICIALSVSSMSHSRELPKLGGHRSSLIWSCLVRGQVSWEPHLQLVSEAEVVSQWGD